MRMQKRQLVLLSKHNYGLLGRTWTTLERTSHKHNEETQHDEEEVS